MVINCMGRVNVSTPGTPVRLATHPSVTAAKLFIQVIPGLTGKAYVGTPSLDKLSLAGVARVLWPNSGGGLSDQFYVESQDGTNAIRLMDYAIDMDIAGEGLLVTYWTE